MSPESLVSPENRLNYVLKLAQKGLDTSTNTLGYHSTSIESLYDLIQRGFLPGRTTKPQSSATPEQLGDLYFIPQNLEPHWSRKEALKQLQEHARLAAIKHYLLTHFGFAWDNQEAKGWFEDIASDIIFNKKPHPLTIQTAQSRLSLDENKLRWAIQRAIKRQGLTLSIKITAVHAFGIRHDYRELVESILMCPNGLDYYFINGLVANGKVEARYLKYWEHYAKLKTRKTIN